MGKDKKDLKICIKNKLYFTLYVVKVVLDSLEVTTAVVRLGVEIAARSRSSANRESI